MNTEERARAYEVKVSGLPGIHVWGEATIGVPAATSRMIPLRVRAEPGAAPGSHPIEFTVTALGADTISVHEDAVFFVR
jgi:hypothetical protein